MFSCCSDRSGGKKSCSTANVDEIITENEDKLSFN